MPLRVYLDTSVFSAYFDDRLPGRQEETRRFWDRLQDFEVVTSEVTQREIEDTPDPHRRSRLLALLPDIAVLALTDEAARLASRYVAVGVFSEKTADDARHVAVATLCGADVLVSWNLRHLANPTSRAAIGAWNAEWGLPGIRIVPPPDV